MSLYAARRATMDDLAQLEELWRAEHWPVDELGKHFTDFQVAQDSAGRLLAAIALQIEGTSGKIHSETYADFGLTDLLRPRLWERVQTVAQNHGLFRLWTEETAPFWKKSAGFTAPADDVLQKFPAAFGSPGTGWLALRLKDEGADPELLDQQFIKFKEAEEAKREKMRAHASMLRFVGTAFSVLLFLFALFVLFSFFRRQH